MKRDSQLSEEHEEEKSWRKKVIDHENGNVDHGLFLVLHERNQDMCKNTSPQSNLMAGLSIWPFDEGPSPPNP